MGLIKKYTVFKSLLISLVIILISTQLSAFEFNLKDRIETRAFYKNNYDLIFGSVKYSDKVRFKKIYHTLTKPTRDKIDQFIKITQSHIPEQILMPLLYWRFLRHNKIKTADVLTYLFMDKILIMRDYSEDPIYKKRIHMHNRLREITHINDLKTDQIYSKVYPLLKEKSMLLANLKDEKVFIQALMETTLFTINLQKEIGTSKTYLLDHYGFIPGNNVHFLNKYNSKKESATWFNKNTIYQGGVLNFEAPYIQMPYRKSYSGHSSFKKDPILKSVKKLIDSAEESILMDMYMLGGTLGATIAEYILDKTKEKLILNKKFKVLILSDLNSHQGFSAEVFPIHNYIYKRIKKDPELKKAVYLLQSNVQRNPYGHYPITKKNDQQIKKDHSKVIIIDANTKSPEALIGSKSLTDHFGGFFLDSAVHIIGPGAALMQASYLYDIKAALTNDQKERDHFKFKDKGLANQNYISKKDEILKSFKINRTHYPYVGNDRIRLAESDVDGVVKSNRNILIDMILNAKKNIYMEQRFLYDSYIVDTLIKKKISIPSLEIKIILDNNRSVMSGGLPNTFFMSDLLRSGIEIRTRDTFAIKAKFPNGKTEVFFQENHRNVTLIDGKMALTGSATIAPDSHDGHDREMSIQLYSDYQVKRYQSEFLKDWNNDKTTLLLDIENFQAVISGKSLSKSYSAIINNMATMILRNREHLIQED